MGELNDLTLAEARDGLAAGDFSAAELTEECIAAMEAARDLNAFITETPEIARERAATSDARRGRMRSTRSARWPGRWRGGRSRAT